MSHQVTRPPDAIFKKMCFCTRLFCNFSSAQHHPQLILLFSICTTLSTFYFVYFQTVHKFSIGNSLHAIKIHYLFYVSFIYSTFSLTMWILCITRNLAFCDDLTWLFKLVTDVLTRDHLSTLVFETQRLFLVYYYFYSFRTQRECICLKLTAISVSCLLASVGSTSALLQVQVLFSNFYAKIFSSCLSVTPGK